MNFYSKLERARPGRCKSPLFRALGYSNAVALADIATSGTGALRY